MPIGHLGLAVSDLPAAKEYFDALMPRVGFEPFVSDDRHFAYRPADNKIGTWLFFYRADRPGHDRHSEGLQHLAFIVKTRDEVRKIHEWAMAQGGRSVREPQELPQYHEGYYSSFWEDPRSFLLEVVCHRER